MAKLIWTQKAIESLEAIYDYISRDSIQYANYQTRKIVESVKRLSIFPESGKITTEFEQSFYRQVIVGTYRVVYRFDGSLNTLFIVNIVHGSRLLTDFHVDEPTS